ncbi:histidine kinase [Chitinophagaceae bacterium MMS25-I14]
MQRTARLLFFILLLFAGYPVYAQKYSVIHYDKSNGFPGSYGYQMYQDRHGYIWISTENGLARFNGYEFKLFTTKDGLPDNEVFGMKEDARGRLWFIPFANAVGYIENEKVHSTENDPLLKKLHFKARPRSLEFDKDGNMFIMERNLIYRVSNKGTVDVITNSWFGSPNALLGGAHSDDGKCLITYGHHIFNMSMKGVIPLTEIRDTSWLNYRLLAITSQAVSAAFSIKARHSGIPFYNSKEVNRDLNCIALIPPSSAVFTTRGGCFIADTVTAHFTDTLLYGYNVAPILKATDGALWLGTHGNGIFRFINSPVKVLKLPVEQSSVLFIKGEPNGAYALLEHGKFVRTSIDKNGSLWLNTLKRFNPKELYDIYVYLGQDSKNNWISCGSQVFKQKNISSDPYVSNWWGYCKDVAEENAETLLVAASMQLVRVDKNSLEAIDTLVNERTTSVAICGHTIYAGTLNGLIAGNRPGSFKRVFSSVPALNRHIVKLCAGKDSILWVANNKAELTGIKNGRIIVFRNNDDGLQCNRISAIKASARFIWVGTDNGLYAIQNSGDYPVARHLTYTTGLSSNLVNCLDVQGSNIWVGTTKGINYFNENEVQPKSAGRNLLINSITNGGDNIEQRTGIISLYKKELAVDFDIIDLTGDQKPLLQYRLDDDGAWIHLENSNLYFPSVPYGDFKISIRARSPNWDKETLRTLRFYRPYPVYMRWWFVLLVFLALGGVIYAVSAFFIRRVRKKDREKLSVQRNLLQLEQMALRSQMNPHFIFNTMSAMKQYYNSGDIVKANDFVDVFASLIRDTFEMGTEPFLSLDKELHYLQQYLAVEKARADDAFEFFITGDTEQAQMNIPVPSMLLQPLVENAVRHGVRHLSGRKGIIKIAVTQKGDTVKWIIEDNGVGRAKSSSFNHKFRNAVTSTVVNTRRIDILNRLFDQKIIFITEDITDTGNNAAGTRVIISYPLSIGHL